MYWQKRFDREDPDEELKEEIIRIRKENKDFGYRRIHGALENKNIHVNRKKVQRIERDLGLQVSSYTRKSRKYSSSNGLRISSNVMAISVSPSVSISSPKKPQ